MSFADPGVGGDPVTPIDGGPLGMREGIRKTLLRIWDVLLNIFPAQVWSVDLAGMLNNYRDLRNTGSTQTTADTETAFNIAVYVNNGKEGVLTVRNSGSNAAIVRIEATSGGDYYGWATLVPDTTLNPGEVMYTTFQGPWNMVRVVHKNALAGSSTTLNIHARWV